MRGLFVTGTDTDVGKTIVSAGLLKRLRAAGLDAVPMKPVQTGAMRRGQELRAPDFIQRPNSNSIRKDRSMALNVTLVFPPVSSPFTSPPPSLAALKAYLGQQGVATVETRDLNIEFFRFLLDHWERMCPAFAERFRRDLKSADLKDDSRQVLVALLYVYLPSLTFCTLLIMRYNCICFT